MNEATNYSINQWEPPQLSDEILRILVGKKCLSVEILHDKLDISDVGKKIQELLSELKKKVVNYEIMVHYKSDETTVLSFIQLLGEGSIISLQKDVIPAIQEFSRVANELMQALIVKLGIHLGEFKEGLWQLPLPEESEDKSYITAREDWSYEFHGVECRFKNQETKQVLEVKLEYPGIYDVIDPYFFSVFLETSQHWVELNRGFRDKYHHMLEVLETLEQQGTLCRVTSFFENEGFVLSKKQSTS